MRKRLHLEVPRSGAGEDLRDAPEAERAREALTRRQEAAWEVDDERKQEESTASTASEPSSRSPPSSGASGASPRREGGLGLMRASGPAPPDSVTSESPGSRVALDAPSPSPRRPVSASSAGLPELQEEPAAPPAGIGHAAVQMRARRAHAPADEGGVHEPVLRFRFHGVNPMLAIGDESTDAAPDDRSAMRSLYGSVRLAVDTATDRVVAIKCSSVTRLRRKLRRNASFDNPVSEAALLRALPPHPHLVELVGEWVQGGTHYLAMARAPGCDLMAYAEAEVRFSTRAARAVFAQTLSAVAHLHRHGVAHLDLSCENVMAWREPSARGRWHATVIDLGAAREAGPRDTLPGGQPGRRVHLPGKPGYHAPEMYTDEAWSPHAADAYACGVVLFALLLDAQPYAVPRADDAHFAQLRERGMRKYLDEWGMGSALSESALDLVSRLMDPDPDTRLTVRQARRHPWVVG